MPDLTPTLPAITDHPSPNCGPRRDGLHPTLIVLHYTAMATAASALERLCDPVAEVSAHYLIASSGQITRLVPEDLRAWHAGAGEWQGQKDINSRSIGIELDNRGTHPFAEPQMTALEQLLAGIMARWSIPPSGVIGHSDMAPGRKFDPGPNFDWARLARQGLASRGSDTADGIETATPDIARFRSLARATGFTAAVSDEVLLEATRLRFAPWRQGALHPMDLQLRHVLAD